MVVAYSEIRDRLLKCLDEINSSYSIRAFPYEELHEKILNNSFNLVVVGQFKRGKTSLINALLGIDILPVAVVPLTSIVTILKYGQELRVTVSFNNGDTMDIEPQSLSEYVTEKGNPKNIKDVQEVVITYPSQYLKDGVRLIDTPGVGSIYQHNTDVAYQYLPKSDAALFLLSVDQPMSKAELDFLKDVKDYSTKIFFLLNKADYLDAKDLQESIDFSIGVLKEVMSRDIEIYPISARLAIEGKRSASEELLKKSGLPAFSEVLNGFLLEDKAKILIVSVANNLLRLLSQAQFQLELELKSLSIPLDELKKKTALFEEKQKESLIEKQDFDILLDGEIKRLLRDVLDEDMTQFRKTLLENAQRHLEEAFVHLKKLPSKELKSALDQSVIEYVRQAFGVWRAKEDDKLAKAFESICKRFVVRTEEVVDTLLRFSSDLFEIPYEAIRTEAFWSTKSSFYYKFKEQPGGIEIVTSSLTLALPKFIGDQIILKKTKDYLIRAVDLQLGRAGNDFEERIQKSKINFRWEMLQRIEATIEGISIAVQKGLAQQDKSTEDIQKTSVEITKYLQGLNKLKNELVEIKTVAEAIRL